MGANFIVTQMFYNIDRYKEFVIKCRDNGIDVPIIPGLKPLTNKKQLISLPKIFHLDIPEELSSAIEECKTNADVQKVSTEWMVNMCKELIDFGVPVLHFYTMSNPGPTKKIVEQLA